MRFVKPIDKDILHEIGKNFKNIITVEDGTIVGGFGSAVLEFMSENEYTVNIKRLGIADKFVDHGTLQELHRECGFDVEGIIKTVISMNKPNILSNVG
jgi:1-deoxy-D-xylulose-5-phosphate synthase